VRNAGRDRLKELLDAVLDGAGHGRSSSLVEMADAAASSPFHFTRLLSKAAGEAPVSMRRRVLLERAAWQLLNGASVTATAFAAGYESVEGFSRAFTRAFGHVPSSRVAGYWLPAPNGIHFHPPSAIWLQDKEPTMNPVIDQLVRHDLDDTRHLIELAKGLPDAEYRAVRMPDTTLLSWHGPEESIAAVLENHVWTKEVWTAAIDGQDVPARDEQAGAVAVLERHNDVAPRWLAAVRDIDRRGAWRDAMIDALCDPPESFPLGAVVAHVLSFAAGRRQVVRVMLRAAGRDVDDGDPIVWARARSGAIGG
jgi:AraC-like DNA-binding protein